MNSAGQHRSTGESDRAGAKVRGTIHVRPDLDHAVWIVVPPYWGGKSWRDEYEWASDVAADCWTASELPYQPADLERLSAVLALTAQSYGPGHVHPEQADDPSQFVQVYLHLPDPRGVAFPVRILVAEGERIEGGLPSLRQLVVADDPEAIDPPDVVQMKHPHFDAGLRAFRHHEVHPGPDDTFEPTLAGVLRYAFPVPGHEAALLVDVTWPDLGRLAGAREDIERLVLGLAWVYYPPGS